MKTEKQMDQIRAEMVQYVATHAPCSGYRIFNDLGIAETTARQNLRRLVEEGRLDSRETQSKILYTIPKAIRQKDKDDTAKRDRAFKNPPDWNRRR